VMVIPNNGRVLFAGGFASHRAVEHAEVFIPWRGTFEHAAPDTARGDGEVVVIGRVNSDGKLVSTSTYGSPTVSVKDGAIRGRGWAPGERVKISQPGGEEISAVADSSGRIAASLPGSPAYVLARGETHDAGARITH